MCGREDVFRHGVSVVVCGQVSGFMPYSWHVFSLFVHQIYRIVSNRANNRSLFLLKHCYKKVIEEGRGVVLLHYLVYTLY